MSRQFETVIGLEVHVELATKTKIFCACKAAFKGAPNTHTCPVCTGMPGTLPVLNKKVVEYAIAVGIAADCSIMSYCQFDRKNYFYPDNPQNYQISQLYLPICRNGTIEIEAADGKKKIGITEIHMEEDAGKLIHNDKENCTLVDYNRAGVPLLEIVSEPDMRSAEEVIAYLEKLKTTIQYLGVSDCRMQEGSMRADVNLSIREAGSTVMGTRTEMKNMSSFKAISRAIQGEKVRQSEVLLRGEKVIQETRRWEDTKGVSYPMRSKEDAQDYRYFPEPDLMPIIIDSELIEQIKKQQPELRTEKMERYRNEYKIPEYDIGIITASKQLADLFEETAAICKDPKKVSNWLMGETMRLMKEQEIEAEDLKFSASHLAKLIALADKKQITGTIAKEVFEIMFAENIDPEQYVEEKGLNTVEDTALLRKCIEETIRNNTQSAADYRNGKEKAIGFLVGRAMKTMKGKADPEKIKSMLTELL